MRELALFAGSGGGILGGKLLGWRTVCAVEIDAFGRSVLLARQRDGWLPRFPIWDDARTFQGYPWRDEVDIITGGFPCQNISSAGRREGLRGEKSRLWWEMARIIREVRPPLVFIENSPHLRSRGLVSILRRLARLGYDAEWCVLGADAIGAPHERKRIWIIAYAHDDRERNIYLDAKMASPSPFDGSFFAPTDDETHRRGQSRKRRPSPSMAGERELPLQTANTDCEPLRIEPRRLIRKNGEEEAVIGINHWWPVDFVSGVDDGMANRMDRVRATGNGQVAPVVALAWRILTRRILRDRPKRRGCCRCVGAGCEGDDLPLMTYGGF